ncbi:MAG: NUDIX domain-containing protein [Candidatus Nanosalina sp.]
MKPEILAEDFSEIEVSYQSREWQPSQEEIREDIDKEMEELEEEGWYNGKLYRLQDHELSDGTLYLRLQDTDYASYSATRNRGYPKEERADPLSLTAVVTDGSDVLAGKRTLENETSEGEWGLPAGMLERDMHPLYFGLDSKNPVYDEVKEETDLNPRDFENIEYLSLVNSERHNPSLAYRMEISSKDALSQTETRELEELEFVDPSEYLERDVTPNSRAIVNSL